MELPEAASSRLRAIGDVSHRVSIWNKLNTMKNEPDIWNRRGYRVVRFWNNQVEKEMDEVIKMLETIIDDGK